MPNPKDPKKLQEYRERMRQIALSRGYGKWMKGRKPTDETKKKRAASLKKKFNTPEMKAKLSKVAKDNGYGKWMEGRFAPGVSKANKRRKGKTYKELYGKRWKEEVRKRRDSNRRRWKGKHKKQRDRHNGEARYKTWRNKVYRRDDYTCQLCGLRGGELNAHHVKPWATYPKLRYRVSNGITYCKSCHDWVHGK